MVFWKFQLSPFFFSPPFQLALFLPFYKQVEVFLKYTEQNSLANKNPKAQSWCSNRVYLSSLVGFFFSILTFVKFFHDFISQKQYNITLHTLPQASTSTHDSLSVLMYISVLQMGICLQAQMWKWGHLCGSTWDSTQTWEHPGAV